uniref:Peptidase A2 domain-containing protein n=1 Tax=Amphiprion percula TaxID=161767 RepID=A0A3P8U1U3_AMPPE
MVKAAYDKDSPTKPILINGKVFNCLCDTGACTTVLRDTFPVMRLSNNVVWVKSASGHVTPLRTTHPATILDPDCNNSAKMSVLVDSSCPVNLLGRDAMVKLNIGVIPDKDGKMTAVTLQTACLVEGAGGPHFFWSLDLVDEPTSRHLLTMAKDKLEETPRSPDDSIKVKLVKPDRPKLKQYPLTQEAHEGIGPVIEDMLKAGILRKTDTPICKTPIFPVKKANGKWRMVQDLRAVNAIVEPEPVEVANPHTLLNNIGSRDKWFSVVAFQYNGQMYTYTRLPQGFTNSPTLYSQALRASMTRCSPLINGQYLLYVDDILITGHTKQDCERNTLTVYLQSDTVLAFPNYSLPFTLFVSSHQGFMSAVLTQPFGAKHRPLAFYSKKLDAVASGVPACVQACTAIAEAIEASSDIVLTH